MITESPIVVREGANAKLANRLMFAAPDECKFKDFASIKQHAQEQRARSRELSVDLRRALFATRPEEDGTMRDYIYIGEESLRLTNQFYKQVATEAGIPLSTLEMLKPDTRVRVLNELWEPKRTMREAFERKFLLEQFADGKVDVRAMTGTRYERLWDDEVFSEVDKHLLSNGWVPAYPTFNIDPDMPVEERPKALIRQDSYSFTFYFTEPKFRQGDGFSNSTKNNGGYMGSPKNPGDTDGLGGLRRGIMVYNGETGHKSFGWEQFLFRNVCSNFNIWDLREGLSKRVRHTKSVREAFEFFMQDVQKLSGDMTDLEMSQLKRAAALPFASNDEEAVKRLNKLGVTQANSKAGVEAAHEEINGANLSLWSIVNGLTWHAKALGNEEDRVELSRQAGHVLNNVLAMA